MKILSATAIGGAAVFSKTPMPMTGDDRDISLYFHIPFCSKKCPYCHFFVLPDNEKLKRPFTEALLKEWKLRLPQLAGKRIVSIYFGGGTPTKLHPDEYRRLLTAVYASVQVAPDCEITLEANPEDVDLALMLEFKLLGINRVSIGVQSLNQSDLTLLERTHTAKGAFKAIEDTAKAGIANISIDLMFELPRQTLQTWEKSLTALQSLPISHLSLYNLTFEQQTIFFKRQKQLLPLLPPDEERVQMLQMAVESLESIGLMRYEISAFARPGMQSRHNTGYWTGRPFIGLGPSAFSYWDGMRFSNAAHFNKYLTTLEQGHFPVDFEESLAYPRNIQELLAVNLRLLEGVDMERFTAKYGMLPPSLEKALSQLIEKNWLTKDADRLKLTASGQLFYDSVAAEIV